jgi:hypothetical protein
MLVRGLGDRGISAQACRPALDVEPSGENGTYAIPCSRANSTISSFWRVDDAVAVLDRGHVDGARALAAPSPDRRSRSGQIELALRAQLLERGQLLLERGQLLLERGQLLLERYGGGSGLDQTEVDEVQPLHSK